MNNRLYSHLYLDLKYIFILKKRSTLANFLMEEPVNLIAIAKIGKRTCIFTLGQFSQFLLGQINHLVSP